jgi:hypothetical protein
MVSSRDLAIYSYAGRQVAEGVPPYVGNLNRAGPLAHLIPAIGVAGARVGGFEECSFVAGRRERSPFSYGNRPT